MNDVIALQDGFRLGGTSVNLLTLLDAEEDCFSEERTKMPSELVLYRRFLPLRASSVLLMMSSGDI